jgi:hypothetical protein
MKRAFVIVLVVTAGAAWVRAQEQKPVPKNSARVFVPGCSKGYVFTAGQRTEDSPGTPVPPGTHLRLSGPKSLLAEIRQQEGTRIEITGLIKKGQIAEDGVGNGRVRITGGPPQSGGLTPNAGVSQIVIDVEGWRRVIGECPAP